MIIKTFKEFLDVKQIIQPFCNYMAHIDVWCGVGTWLEEGRTGTNKDMITRNLCSYISESKHLLLKVILYGIYVVIHLYIMMLNLVMKKKKEDEKDEKDEIDEKDTNASTSIREAFNNLLITGPNGSGKSTYIKSVIECILLGHRLLVLFQRKISLLHHL